MAGTVIIAPPVPPPPVPPVPPSPPPPSPPVPVPPTIPPATGCCPTLYWCDGAGNIVAANQRPGVGYSGPWRSALEASDNCGLPPPLEVGLLCGLTCAGFGPYCSTLWEMPSDGVTLSFVNKVGVFTTLPNSYFLPYNYAGPLPCSTVCESGSCVGSGPLYANATSDTFPFELVSQIQYCTTCLTTQPGGNPEVGVLTARLYIIGLLRDAVGCALGSYTFTYGSGWSGGLCNNCIGGWCFGKIMAGCGEVARGIQLICNISTPVGTSGCTGGSVDVYLGV